jgi:hypothetical protein
MDFKAVPLRVPNPERASHPPGFVILHVAEPNAWTDLSPPGPNLSAIIDDACLQERHYDPNTLGRETVDAGLAEAVLRSVVDHSRNAASSEAVGVFTFQP